MFCRCEQECRLKGGATHAEACAVHDLVYNPAALWVRTENPKAGTHEINP